MPSEYLLSHWEKEGYLFSLDIHDVHDGGKINS